MTAEEILSTFQREVRDALDIHLDREQWQVCQCGTENLIKASSDPSRTRGLLLIGCAIRQAIQGASDFPVGEFLAERPYLRLEPHGPVDGEVRSDWVLCEQYGWHLGVDWSMVARTGQTLIADLRAWMDTRSIGCLWPDIARNLRWLPHRMREYNPAAASRLARTLSARPHPPERPNVRTRIYLVTHGETTRQVNGGIDVTGGPAVPLTARGLEQAREAGLYLRRHFESLNELFESPVVRSPVPDLVRQQNGQTPLTTRTHRLRAQMWVSPYHAAVQTADEIETALDRSPQSYLRDRRQHLLLADQQRGVVDAMANREVQELLPGFAPVTEGDDQSQSRFFVRPLGGESLFDLCVRIHQTFVAIQQDAARLGIREHIIVAHGPTILAFVMMWRGLPFEWFERQTNPRNGSVRLIEGQEDFSYVHGE